MVKLGVGFKCSDREKRPACSLPRGPVGGAEAKDCSGGRRGGFPSSWGRPAAGCCLRGKEPQSLQHQRDLASVSQNQVPGGTGAVRQQGYHLCQTAVPHLRIETSFRSTHSALSTEGDTEMNQAQAPTFKELPCHWGGATPSEPGVELQTASCGVIMSVRAERGDITKGQWHFGDTRKCRHL